MTDLISRADAIRVISEEYHNRGGNFDGLDAVRELETLPSKGGDAEVNETKSPYMQHSRHDDGRLTREKAVKWVKFVHDVLYEDKDEEIREALNMAIEALSAEAVQEWIPFKKRPLTDEEKQEYPDWAYIFDCPLPDDEEEILLSNGKYVWTDTFINDGECYLDGGDDIDEGMAWMPLPKPYKGGAE